VKFNLFENLKGRYPLSLFLSPHPSLVIVDWDRGVYGQNFSFTQHEYILLEIVRSVSICIVTSFTRFL